MPTGRFEVEDLAVHIRTAGLLSVLPPRDGKRRPKLAELQPATSRPQLRLPRACALLPEGLHQFLQRQRVDDVRLLQPTLARHARAQPQEREVFLTMRVGVDHALHSLALRVLPVPPVHVESPWIAVELDPRPGLRARVDDRLRIDRVTIPLEEQATGHVA